MLRKDRDDIDGDDPVFHEILKRQTRAIERLAKHFSPEEAEKEERRSEIVHQPGLQPF